MLAATHMEVVVHRWTPNIILKQNHIRWNVHQLPTIYPGQLGLLLLRIAVGRQRGEVT